jgi:hypothetical protein
MASMGIEAECTVRVGRKTSTGKALLEGETLIFRGEFSLQIPFDGMRSVSVDGPALVVVTSDQEARFEVGPVVAERWLRLIKEPKGLFEKLEVGPQSRIAVVDMTDSLFVTALRERTASVVDARVPQGVNAIFFGAESKDALRKLHLLRARMGETATLWIVRPKGSKAIAEGDVYEAVRAASLVDTKVVAFSKTHTAHKCVIPVEMRGQPLRIRPLVMTIPPSAPSLQPKKTGPAKAGLRPSKPSLSAKAKSAKPTKAAKSAKPSKRPPPPKPKSKAKKHK